MYIFAYLKVSTRHGPFCRRRKVGGHTNNNHLVLTTAFCVQVLSCNHVLQAAISIGSPFPWACQIDFPLKVYLVGLPNTWQPLIAVLTCSAEPVLLAVPLQVLGAALCVLGTNLCFHTQFSWPAVCPNCPASPGCTCELWRFGGLGRQDPQCIISCVRQSPVMWKLQGINLVLLHPVLPEECIEIE